MKARPWLGLAALFALVYFVQGVGEPTDGLIAQPLHATLRRAGAQPSDLARFAAIVAIPWTLKPLFGFLIDFAPLGRSRHRAWLTLATAVAAASTLALAFTRADTPGRLLALAVVPTAAVAFADVAADALMIERGRPLGITGVLQSVQWSAIYAASIMNGELGGWLTARHDERIAFYIVAGLSALSCVLVATMGSTRAGAANETARRDDSSSDSSSNDSSGDGATTEPPTEETSPTPATLFRAFRSKRLAGAAIFLFLLSFNPFSSAIEYGYMTNELGMDEHTYGRSTSLGAVAALLASMAYGLYCRRIGARARVHVSVVLAALATLPYVAVTGPSSLFVASIVASATYATASLVQLDIAAQACPPALAGTAFSLLMSLANAGLALGTWVGGSVWELSAPSLGPHVTFRLLVIAGTVATALGWFVMPWLLEPDGADAAPNNST